MGVKKVFSLNGKKKMARKSKFWRQLEKKRFWLWRNLTHIPFDDQCDQCDRTNFATSGHIVDDRTLRRWAAVAALCPSFLFKKRYLNKKLGFGQCNKFWLINFASLLIIIIRWSFFLTYWSKILLFWHILRYHLIAQLWKIWG